MTTTRSGSMMWEQLPMLLDRMIEAHERWLGALEAHQKAIGIADSTGIDDALRAEREHAEAVERLDRERRELLELPARPVPGRPEPTITELAKTRPAPERTELLQKANSLRILVERVRRHQAVIREASSSVLSHMRGLMHQLSARLSHSGTYGAGGKVAAGPVVVSGLDIKQ
ncbi:MAG: flagellar protein FlgN [Planctomycetota bacterium]